MNNNMNTNIIKFRDVHISSPFELTLLCVTHCERSIHENCNASYLELINFFINNNIAHFDTKCAVLYFIN